MLLNPMVETSRTIVEDAVRSACIVEIGALKPGNVSVHSEGHGMRVSDFVRSAYAIAPILSAPMLTVGERILGAIRATRRVTQTNTNLGIVLLCAPLAHAALEAERNVPLRLALEQTLARLDRRDARLAYRAIRLAGAGHLGTVNGADISESDPDVTLLVAMQMAADRDAIAAQYTNNFADVFELALPGIEQGMERWEHEEWATVLAYLRVLSAMPDTLVIRKFGPQVAAEVRTQAARLSKLISLPGANPMSLSQSLKEFDETLKRRGINPGTSADLTVAALMIRRLQQYEQHIELRYEGRRQDGGYPSYS